MSQPSATKHNFSKTSPTTSQSAEVATRAPSLSEEYDEMLGEVATRQTQTKRTQDSASPTLVETAPESTTLPVERLDEYRNQNKEGRIVADTWNNCSVICVKPSR